MVGFMRSLHGIGSVRVYVFVNPWFTESPFLPGIDTWDVQASPESLS